MLDVDTIEITDEQAYDARLLASRLSNSQTRKRGMLDMLGISCALNYFKAKKVKIDNQKSVYKIPLLFEEFKIADLYYDNYRIDVITLYKEKTIKIPRVHVEMDIIPHFYFVVQIGAKIKEAKMIGFIEGRKITSCNHDSKYYYPTLNMLFDFDKFAALTKHSVPSTTIIGKHIDCMGLFLKFIDNDLSSVYKRQLIQHLMNCDSCRARFIDTMEFDNLAGNIHYYPDILKRFQSKPKVQIFNKKDEEHNLEKRLNASKINQNSQLSDINNENSQEIAQMFDIDTNPTSTKQLSKKVIDTIFNEMPKIELSGLSSIMTPKNKRSLLVILSVFIILLSFALISIKTNTDITNEDDETELPTLAEMENDYREQTPTGDIPYEGRQLVEHKQTIDDFTINQPVMPKAAYTPTISNVAWEAPENVIKKDSYTKFLQLTGKNIKLNLQNELLLVNDIPTNKSARIDIKVSPNGDIEGIKLVQSSGSNQIDGAIQRVISDTLKFIKPPKLGFGSKAVKLSLTINLL